MKRTWQTYQRVSPYLRPRWKLAVFSMILVFVAAGLSMLLPWPLALVFDSVLGNKPLPAIVAPLGSLDRVTLLILLALAGLALTAGSGILAVLDDYVNTKLDQRLVLAFRSDLFEHAQRLSPAYHERRSTGGFAAQINLQSAGAGAIVVAIPPAVQAFVTLVGMFTIAMLIDVPAALVGLSVVPFVYYSTGYYAKQFEPRLIQVREMEGESLSIVHEAMAMLRVIVPFTREPYEHGRFYDQGERAVHARVNLTVRQTMFSSLINLITGVGTALVLGVGAYRIMRGYISPGELLVMMTYIASAYAPLQQLGSTYTSLQEQFVNLRGALRLLDAEPEVEDAPGAYAINRVEGSVSFDGVHFSYQGRAGTLKDISFEAQAGQHVAIVGPTGAGKTTLTTLMLRFYDPQQGRILLDGIDIRKLTLKSLREQITTVTQEPLLFSGNIAENIRYGRLDASMEEVVEAAKAANAHDFIMRLPDKYETKLGEGGKQLSAGERQRITIARAFMKDAPILILDEPTSSIDSKTEAIILDSLKRLAVGRTTFMIAHRLSTIRNSDLILVIDNGKLAEHGTHDELLERRGLYRQLYTTQTGLAEREGWPERLQRLGQPLEHNGGRRHGRHDARIGRATHAKLGDEVEYVGGPAGDARYIELSDVTLSEPDPERLWGRHIDLPKPNTQTEASAVDLMGWVLGKSSPALAIELLHEGKVIRRVPLTARPDIAKARPDVPRAEQSGFHATVSFPEAASEFEVSLQAVLQDQSRVPIGVIRGSRRWGDEEEERHAAAVSASANAQRAIDKVHQNGGKEADLTTQGAKTRTHQTSVTAPSLVEQTGNPAKGHPSGLFRPIRERLWVMLLAAVTLMSVAVAYNLARTPEYEASVLSIGLAVLTVSALGAGQAFRRERRSPKTTTEEPPKGRPSQYSTNRAPEQTPTALPSLSAADNAKAGRESRRNALRKPGANAEQTGLRQPHIVLAVLIVSVSTIVAGLYLGWHLGMWLSAILGM